MKEDERRAAVRDRLGQGGADNAIVPHQKQPFPWHCPAFGQFDDLVATQLLKIDANPAQTLEDKLAAEAARVAGSIKTRWQVPGFALGQSSGTRRPWLQQMLPKVFADRPEFQSLVQFHFHQCVVGNFDVRGFASAPETRGVQCVAMNLAGLECQAGGVTTEQREIIRSGLAFVLTVQTNRLMCSEL